MLRMWICGSVSFVFGTVEFLCHPALGLFFLVLCLLE